MSLIDDVIVWYKQYKRDLPWRSTTDAYTIWLSEVIMQQTRVDQGLPYFHKFLESYPTVSDFAAASEDEILNHWQGLGYYSRGRNMHKTANMVMEEHAGYFPTEYDKLIKLKGIGEYTAAAISSFSANEARAVVDGNVFRVLARYFGIDEPINTSKAKKLFTNLANEVIDCLDPATSNQALMEFGALQCTPRKPLCSICPLQLTCNAFQNNLVDKLPVKLKKTGSKNRYFNYFVVIKEGEILLNKRGANDIWENLHELPLVETDYFVDSLTLMNEPVVKNTFSNGVITGVHIAKKHVLSHQNIHAQFLVIETDRSELEITDTGWFFAKLNDLEHLAQPKLIFAFLKNFLS